MSPSDSLVTVEEFRTACRRIEVINEIVTRAAEDVDDAESVLGEALTPEDTAEATLEVERLRGLAAQADTQLVASRSLISDSSQAGLGLLCGLDGSAGSGAPGDVRLPSRADIKRAPDIAVEYNPRNEQLGADPKPGFLPFIGIGESQLVSGLANFLVERAATEIQLAFIDRFNKWACVAPREVVFESTCRVLAQDHLALHTSVLRELKTGIEEDLKRLPRSGPLAVITSESFKNSLGTLGEAEGSFSTGQQDLVLTLYFAGTLLEAIVDGKEPLQALSTILDRDPGLLGAASGAGLFIDALSQAPRGSIQLPVSAGLQRLALVPRMLDTDDQGNIDWPEDATERRNFAGTLAVNLGGWLSELGVTADQELGTVLDHAVVVSAAIADSKRRYDVFQSRLNDLSALETATLAEYAKVVDEGLAIVEVFAVVVDALSTKGGEVGQRIANLRQVAKGLAGRDYAIAIIGLYAVAEDIADEELELPEGAIRFASFITALAQAESSSEVTAVLHSYAAPPLSYRAKRETGSYITLNGYLGASVGWETVPVSDVTRGFAGVHAPVGLEVGGSLGKVSLGLFAQVLDLGALASYRMTADEDALASEPEVGFAQVLSPGVYAVLGFPNVPLTLGFGVDYAPELRKLTDGSGDTVNATRIGVFLGIDIPLLRLK